MDVFIHEETGLRWSDSVIELISLLLPCGSVVKQGLYFAFAKSENTVVTSAAIGRKSTILPCHARAMSRR